MGFQNTGGGIAWFKYISVQSYRIQEVGLQGSRIQKYPGLGFFYFNCEHVLFVYIVKQKQKNIANFQKSQNSNFVTGKFVKIRLFMTINLPWGPARSHKQFEPDRFSRFDISWILTNRQTDIKVYI